MQDLHEVQLALEAEAVSLGIERYQAALEARGEAELPPGMKLIRQAIIPLTEAIDAFMAEATSGRPGRDVGRAKYLKQFSTQNVAYITAKACVSMLGMGYTVQIVAMSIAKTLEDCVNYDEIKKADIKLYHRLLKKIRESGSGGNYRHIVMRNAQNKAQIATVKWDKGEKLALGLHLIRLMEQATGLIELVRIQTGNAKDTPMVIRPTPDTAKWLEKSHAHCELLNPPALPMVVPPREWNSVYGGGFMTKHLSYSLIKTRNRNYLEEMKSWDMPKVFRTVNALQNTGWRINKAVLKVLSEVWEGGGMLGKLPPRDDLPLPAKSYTDPEENPEAHKQWKRQAAGVYEENMKMQGKRFSMGHKLRVAEKFQDFDAIYYPHVLDWRGRIYPATAHLNPQSDDPGKALLQFAEGKPLGPNGAYWLAVHGANCAGVDKVSFEDRVKWVEDHHEQIIDSALDPLDGGRFWSTVDSPYQFLAFCFEWLGYSLQGEAFVSHLSVSWDGSCNGLQNYSAMLRDQIGGKATNLVPSDKPSDIYTEVAAAAEFIVECDALQGNEVAQAWKGKIVRSIAKTPTMTKPYGARRFGFRGQIEEAIAKIERETGEQYLSVPGFTGANYLAGVMDAAIGRVVIKAAEAMAWLEEVATIAASDGLPVWWTTPSGYMVVQDYRKYVGKRIDTFICGVRTQLTLSVESDDLDERKQAQGIAPNFVHSMDASHLALTVGRCLDAGVTSFAMIHDSYGTHAADTEILSEQLREAFIEQYSPDVLGKFLKEIKQQVPPELAEKLPPMPEFGTLDLAQVRESKYFFA